MAHPSLKPALAVPVVRQGFHSHPRLCKMIDSRPCQIGTVPFLLLRAIENQGGSARFGVQTVGQSILPSLRLNLWTRRYPRGLMTSSSNNSRLHHHALSTLQSLLNQTLIPNGRTLSIYHHYATNHPSPHSHSHHSHHPQPTHDPAKAVNGAAHAHSCISSIGSPLSHSTSQALSMSHWCPYGTSPHPPLTPPTMEVT